MEGNKAGKNYPAKIQHHYEMPHYDSMPRAHNAFENGAEIHHGAGGDVKSTDPVRRASNTAPLPEGLLAEVHDYAASGGGSRGFGQWGGSGKGGHEPKHERLRDEKQERGYLDH